MNVNKTVGRNVRAELVRRGVTQERVSAHLHMGQASLSDRLSGKVPFRADELVYISEFIAVPLMRFFEEVHS